MKSELHTEIEIAASPEVVWEILTDLPAYAQWNPFITSAQGEVALGQTLVNRMEPPGARAMTFKPTVTEVEAGRVFEWLGRLGLPGLFDGRHRFTLHPTASGTVLRQSEFFRGLLVRPLMKGLQGPTREGFLAMNEALKARAESR